MSILLSKQRDGGLRQFYELTTLQEQMNRMFDLSLAGFGARRQKALESSWLPKIDLHDYKDKIEIKADMPGMKKQHIKVNINGDMLEIRGEKKQARQLSKGSCTLTERFAGTFLRAVALPATVESAKTRMYYRNGVLALTLFKKGGALNKK